MNRTRVKVGILRSNPVAPDPRVQKLGATLMNAGFNVRIACWDRSGVQPTHESTSFGEVRRFRVKAAYGSGFRNIGRLLRWQAVLTLWLFTAGREIDVIHACDFDTVVPALAFGFVFRRPVLYDIFDFYSDSVRGLPRGVRLLLRSLERRAAAASAGVIVVDERRVEQLGPVSLKRFAVVHNSPRAKELTSPGCLEDPSGKSTVRRTVGLRIAYVGILALDRGLLEMLEVVGRHPTWTLELAGYGQDEAIVAESAKRVPNAMLHGVVDYDKALQIMADSDVLFATYDPSVPNHRYSSPNKLFESMMLGKPIIVALGTGVDSMVKSLGLGYCVPYGNLAMLEAALKDAAAKSAHERASFAAKARATYKARYSWELMEERLLGLYHQILSANPRPRRRT